VDGRLFLHGGLGKRLVLHHLQIQVRDVHVRHLRALADSAAGRRSCRVGSAGSVRTDMFLNIVQVEKLVEVVISMELFFWVDGREGGLA